MVGILRDQGRRGDRHRPDRVPHACRARPIRRSASRWHGRVRLRGSSKPHPTASFITATEGPLGILARRHRAWRASTASLHHELSHQVSGIPLRARPGAAQSLGPTRIVRRFHNAGRGCMVATDVARTRPSAHAAFNNLLLLVARRRPRRCSGRAPEADLKLPRPCLPLRRPRRGGEEPARRS